MGPAPRQDPCRRGERPSPQHHSCQFPFSRSGQRLYTTALFPGRAWSSVHNPKGPGHSCRSSVGACLEHTATSSLCLHWAPVPALCPRHCTNPKNQKTTGMSKTLPLLWKPERDTRGLGPADRCGQVEQWHGQRSAAQPVSHLSPVH